MRLTYIIIIILILSCAQKGITAEPHKLTFVAKDAYKYFQVKRKDTDGSYIDVDILRALKEFKVDKKYCLWNSSNWDDICQDAAMEYAFGSKWPEFKKVALEFLKLTEQEGLVEISKLPDFIRGWAYIMYKGPGDRGRILVDALDIEYFAKKSGLKHDKTESIKYKGLLIDNCNFGDNVNYCIFFSKNFAITFRIVLEDNKQLYKEEGRINLSEKYHYIPEITKLYLFGN